MHKLSYEIDRINVSPASNNDNNQVLEAEHSSKKMLRNIKGIIFDFDGTLFDNALIPIKLISAYPLDALRLWRERLIRKSFAGRDYGSSTNFYNAFFKALGKACHRSKEHMQSWYFNRYMPRMVKVLKKHYKPRQRVNELLTVLDNANPKKTKIAIYSDYPFIKERLEALNIEAGKNTLLYSPESFGAQKPAVRPFLKIASDFGCVPEEVLVIGDREDTDGLGAFNAGMRFFCLETGEKRYLKIDPNRRMEKTEPHGPMLVMYAGFWDDLVNVLIEKYSKIS